MALTYTTESAAATTATRCRRKLHLHCKHRQRGVVCFFYAGIFHKRYLLFLSILYIMGLITCAGPLLSILHPPPPPPPGSLYRSQELFLKLWPEIQSDNSSTVEVFICIYFFLLPNCTVLAQFTSNVGSWWC